MLIHTTFFFLLHCLPEKSSKLKNRPFCDLGSGVSALFISILGTAFL